MTASVGSFSNEIPQRLILVGGGEYPKEAMVEMVNWAGGAAARILVITWASDSGVESFDRLKESLLPFKPGTIEMAPLPKEPMGSEIAREMLAMVRAATGVFFTGGDQVVLMERLSKLPEVLEVIKQRFHEGVVMGGSSAGTAVMSERILTGNGDFTVIDPAKVEVVKGLGFLKGVVVDQHFIRRQRLNRLLGVMLQNHERIALGVDEDTAVAIEDGKHARVLGPEKVIRLERLDAAANEMKLTIYSPGAEFELQ